MAEENTAPGGEEHVDAPEPTEGEVWGEDRPSRQVERDERGRFARKAEEEAAAAAAAAQPGPVAAGPENTGQPPAEEKPAAQAAPAAAQPAPQPDIDAIVAAALAKAGVQPQQPQAPQTPAEPDIATDPEGWKNWFQHTQAIQDWQRRTAWSEARARKEFPDYPEVEKLVLDAADSDPTGRLWARIHRAEAPAYEVYELGKKLKIQQQIEEVGGDPDGWAEKRMLDRMRSDEAFRQKVLTEFQPQPAATAKPHLPPSFATARSTAGRPDPAPSAPTEREVWPGGIARPRAH